jgi:repressor LexA
VARPITERQLEVLRFISKTHDGSGWMPTVAEITESFGWKSTAAAFAHLVALEKKGAIERKAGSPRAIRITSAGQKALR